MGDTSFYVSVRMLTDPGAVCERVREFDNNSAGDHACANTSACDRVGTVADRRRVQRHGALWQLHVRGRCAIARATVTGRCPRS